MLINRKGITAAFFAATAVRPCVNLFEETALRFHRYVAVSTATALFDLTMTLRGKSDNDGLNGYSLQKKYFGRRFYFLEL